MKKIYEILALEGLVFAVSIALKAIEEEEKKQKLCRRGLQYATIR